jgi:hypothetical protein
MLSKGASIALIDELQELSARCAARSPHRRPQPTQRGTRLPAETHSQPGLQRPGSTVDLLDVDLRVSTTAFQ